MVSIHDDDEQSAARENNRRPQDPRPERSQINAKHSLTRSVAVGDREEEETVKCSYTCGLKNALHKKRALFQHKRANQRTFLVSVVRESTAAETSGQW
eukprot:scaffold411_cov171-Ochromonas_danica.AAC.9